MVVLIINRTSSECGNCHRNADPNEESHDMNAMEGEGCGLKFTHVSTEYIGEQMKNDVVKMRPDLSWVDYDTISL